MLDKKVLKDIQSLSSKKHRRELGLFLAEGPKVVEELLLTMRNEIEGIYATATWAAANPEVQSTRITDIELGRISGLQTPNEVVAVLKQREAKEPVMKKGWCIYLDGIQDPGNMGTIIRIADWFGISNIVCSAGCAEVYNPKVVQSTMGSIGRVEVWYDEEGTWLQRQSLPVMVTSLSGTSVYDIEPREGGILVLGNESKGVSETIMNGATVLLTIPRIGAAESLNAAVAAGILLSHLLR